MRLIHITCSLLLLLTVFGLNAQIDQLEYYFDNDPGVGSATPLNPSPSTNIDATFAIPTSALANGFHLLTIRARDISGDWSIQSTTPFYVTASEILTLENLNRIEYYIDTDPGVGLGTPTSFSGGTTLADFVEDIPTSGLGEGFHIATFRAQDANNTWSIQWSTSFYIRASGITSLENIDQIEYFIDQDPGVGNGTLWTGFSTNSEIDYTDLVGAATLDAGQHTITFRVRNDEGEWSLGWTRPFYIAPANNANAAKLLRAEYFFDEDPGIGNALSIDLPDTVSIDMDTLISLAGLSAGFHTLTLRVQDDDSVWSNQQTRSFFIDPYSSTSLDKVEYFIGDDPGFGNGTQVDFPNSTQVDSLIAVNTATLDTGNYHVSFRMVSADTNWSILETHHFRVSNDSCLIDSLALVELYNSTDGPNWTENSGWLNGTLDSWHGVHLNGCVVDSLSLANNNLSGNLPDDLASLNSVSCINLSGNNIDTISSLLLTHPTLHCLNISNMGLSTLPDFSASAITNLDISHNALDFADLEVLPGVDTLVYAPQDTISQDTTITTTVGFPLSLVTTSGGTNDYQWFKDNSAIPGSNDSILSISSTTFADSGAYLVQITNSAFPDLTLYTGTYFVNVLDLDACGQDSLVLVQLYENLNGLNWTNQTGWLNGPVSQWHGIQLSGCRIAGIDLSNNNVVGMIPASIRTLDSLTSLSMNTNQITGFATDSLDQLSALTSLDLADNNIIELPVLPTLDSLAIANNALTFGDLQNLTASSLFTYAPQDTIHVDTTVALLRLETLSLSISPDGTGNVFQWYHDNTELNETSSTFVIDQVQLEDSGAYHVEVSNPALPDLTLIYATFTVTVTDTSSQGTDTIITNNLPISFYALEDIKAAEPDCDVFTVEGIESSNLGTLEQVGDSIRFTPTPGAPIGSDTVSFIAKSGCSSLEILDEIVITVNNSPPELTDVSVPFDVPEVGLISIDLATRVFDFNGNEILDSLKIISPPTSGESAEIDLTYHLNIDYRSSDFRGVDTIVVQVCDSLGECIQKRVMVDFTFVISVFNAVSPNGDNVQDFFLIKNIHRYPDATVSIYTQWGDAVWDNGDNYYDNKTFFFDGRDADDIELPEGTYYYTVELGIADDPCKKPGESEFQCNGFLIIKRD